VAIVVPLLIVLGLLLLAWGAFRLMWDTRWDKIVGGIMLIGSITFISAGAVGLFETIH
jgi:hypothetical protein